MKNQKKNQEKRAKQQRPRRMKDGPRNFLILFYDTPCSVVNGTRLYGKKSPSYDRHQYVYAVTVYAGAVYAEAVYAGAVSRLRLRPN